MLTTSTEVPLAVADRCDRCGAQAKMKATLIAGELLFCGHHAREAGEILKQKSIQIYDPEGYLNG